MKFESNKQAKFDKHISTIITGIYKYKNLYIDQ